MKNFFKRLFGRKHHITIDCETAGLNGESIISINDAAGILRDTKKDFDTLTRILHAMPVKATNLDEANPAVQNQREELWEWNWIARTLHHNIGVDIENLERIMNQRIPSLKDATPTVWPKETTNNELIVNNEFFTRAIEELTK